MAEPQNTNSGKPPTTSPKRFFRAFNQSPFRANGASGTRNKIPNTNPLPPAEFLPSAGPSLSPSFKIHARSQSHDTMRHGRKLSGNTDWTHLIPPLPGSPSPSSRSRAGSNVNRHTIAISPDAIVSIPDMLQPSPNPGSEHSFVMGHQNKLPGSEKENYRSQEKPMHIPRNHASLNGNTNANANSSAAFSAKSTENDASISRAPGSQNTPVDSAGQFWPETTSRGLSRQYSNAKSLKNKSTTAPPKTPPPKLATFTHIQPSSRPQSQYPVRDTFIGGTTREIRTEVSGKPPNSELKPPAPPPLVAQHSQHAVTMVHGQDSGISSGPYQQQPPTFQQQQDQPKQQPLPSQFHQQQPPHPEKPTSRNMTQLQQQKTRPPSSKKRKSCNSCHQVINGQFVRALNNAYHIECFKCHECDAPCSAKFFPHEIASEDNTIIQVPLCEYDYFKKLSLICHTCDSALRGPYITALGHKYHLEHFKCHACGKVFESDESYYEHENSVYCHFHYSQLFATKCEGCQSSIVKQFVELFKSGKVQQWHPECYMVFKFWNVSVTIDSVGLPDKLASNGTPTAASGVSAKDFMLSEQRIESAVLNCWVILSGFEETSASCISEMLLCACSGKRPAGLLATGKLVLHLEVLFRALDHVQNMCMEFKQDSVAVSDSKRAFLEEVYSVDAFDKFQALRKEPRNISGKLMSYLAILRKSTNISESGSLSSELLAVITGCAHYLKLLIRIGLNNALTLNKIRGDSKALDGFLNLVKFYEEIDAADKLPVDAKTSLLSRLAVPYNATDACRACSKSIEKSCIMFSNLRWHHKCFECTECHRKPSNDFKVQSFLYGPNDKILCTDCVMSDNQSGIGYTSGFIQVSDLSQLMYLLKIALSRSRIAMKKENASSSSVDYLKPNSAMSHIQEDPSETETTYSKTLDEVTSLRQMRESQKLRNSVKKNARKSVILEAPEAATAKTDTTSNEVEERKQIDRKASSSSSISYTTSRRDSDHFEFHTNPIKIRDEPPQRITTNSLDRTSDLLKNEKSLTLDDIPRIVAAEQAREQRPNAFKHHNSLYQKKNQPIRSISNNASPHEKAPTFFGDGEGEVASHKYFSELTKQEHSILRHVAIEALLKISDQFSKEELLQLTQSKKQNTFWEKFRFGGGDKGKSVTVFGTDLKEVSKKYGMDTSLGVGPSQLRIPMLIEDIILALRQKDMSVEGIFRLNGNIKNLRELTEQINAAPLKSPNYNNYSAVQLAALMKKWLRELPNPLLTFNLYELWISSRRTGNPMKAKRVLQLSYCLLPRSHRNLLEVLLYFFSWVASFAEIDEETGSKMDTHNLATVLAPNILLSKAASGENGENQSSDAHFLAIEVVNQLIEIHEDLALIPNDIWEFYNKCEFNVPAKTDTIPTKEIQGKIAKVSKEEPDYFLKFMKKGSYSEPSHHNTIKSGQTKVHDYEKSNGN